MTCKKSQKFIKIYKEEPFLEDCFWNNVIERVCDLKFGHVFFIT